MRALFLCFFFLFTPAGCEVGKSMVAIGSNSAALLDPALIQSDWMTLLTGDPLPRTYTLPHPAIQGHTVVLAFQAANDMRVVGNPTDDKGNVCVFAGFFGWSSVTTVFTCPVRIDGPQTYTFMLGVGAGQTGQNTWGSLADQWQDCFITAMEWNGIGDVASYRGATAASGYGPFVSTGAITVPNRSLFVCGATRSGHQQGLTLEGDGWAIYGKRNYYPCAAEVAGKMFDAGTWNTTFDFDGEQGNGDALCVAFKIGTPSAPPDMTTPPDMLIPNCHWECVP